MLLRSPFFTFFFFNDTATTEIYTISLHDALPISHGQGEPGAASDVEPQGLVLAEMHRGFPRAGGPRRAQRRQAVRRRAADAGHRAGAACRAHAAPPGRAVRRARAGGGAADPEDPARAQGGGNGHAARRAEPALRPLAGRPA